MSAEPKSIHGESSRAITPLLAQYQAIKRAHQDVILLFRLGDFYEMFGEDAKIGSQVLELALTSREIGKGRRLPMCGLPYHALERYLPRLLAAGYKAAVCDQTEDPKKARGLVKREVIRILTPGTVVEDFLLEERANNFLLSLAREANTFGLAAIDCSTGNFQITQASSLPRLLEEISRLQPAEILLSSDLVSDETFCNSLRQAGPCSIGPAPEEGFLSASPKEILCRHFQVTSLAGFGCEEMPAAVQAAAAVLLYLQQTQKSALQQIRALRTYSLSEFMILDSTTRRNLELFSNLRDGGRANTLLSLLDLTITAMGARLLRAWMAAPLLQVEEIRRRQQYITSFVNDPAGREKIRRHLRRISDIERLVARAAAATANGRDLAALRDSLFAAPELISALTVNRSAQDFVSGCRAGPPLPAGTSLQPASADGEVPQQFSADSREYHEDSPPPLRERAELGAQREISDSPPPPLWGRVGVGGDEGAPSLQMLAAGADLVSDLRDTLASALADSPPITLREGNLLRPGYNPELDRLRQARSEGKEWIASLEAKERQRTGIKSLRVGFNQVFGYYLEVSRPNLHLVPADYLRKQTLTNGERFITPDLKEYEALVLGAEEKIVALEFDLFCQLRSQVASEAPRLQALSRLIAEIDALSALGEAASRYGYIRPEVDESDSIEITDGRHPVVEANQTEPFIPNDALLNSQEQQLLIITGPNMAGKSTYLRQVALIALIAQMGSFVPAKSARIGLVDRIFTRVGATDDLSSGRSTFMMEMTETANILHNATARSLVILDEIGRGTSTFDGLSIAWAVAEYIHNNLPGAKTLFATHYHHLNDLAQSLPRIKNYRVAVKESGDHIIFLRKVVPGGTDRSYGIQVARLAGLPHQVLERAKEVLWTLEKSNNINPRGTGVSPVTSEHFSAPPSSQLTLFEQKDNPLLRELSSLDLDGMTPREALNKLAEIQSKLKRPSNK